MFPTIGTKVIARRYQVDVLTVQRWMEKGVTVNGRHCQLQFQRIGKCRKTTQEWLDEFIRQCNLETPLLVETTAEYDRRAAEGKEAFRKALLA